MTDESTIYSHPFRVADLPARKATRFDLAPDKAARDRIGAVLDVTTLEDLRLRGELRPTGRRDWVLEAKLTAKVTQPCVVTLAPVVTRIEETVTRQYLAEWTAPEGEEVEMPEDDNTEPLPAINDAGTVLIEALTLALPLYPRADGAELGETRLTEPGAEPLSDDDLKPFAGLADLIKKSEDQA
ncbi:MAG: DUF177 domain-containing protein [Albidovulum sp.]|uniref:DUF177 domain-containing protein n=1 Tax=Albidovulum sp. TaxID=1872424 RepID=UPI003CA7FDC3